LAIIRFLDSSVSIATVWTAGVLFVAEARCFSTPQLIDRLWGPPSLQLVGFGDHFFRAREALTDATEMSLV
jgi:hypothetical protein